MKKIIFIFILNLLSLTTVFASEKIQFNDIDNHWAKEDILLLVKDSVVQGYSDNTFRPNNYVSVSEFLKMLVEMADFKLETLGERWPNWYIQTAIKNNLIENEYFDDYTQNITRYEVAQIIGKYINLEDVSKNKNTFTDLNSAEKEIVLKLVKLGVVNGYSDNTFKPNNFITRAEACKIIINSYDAKQELQKNRKSELISELTNIYTNENQDISNTYKIINNRIYIYDKGRYANLNGQTLNQEYIKDKVVIDVLKTLVGTDSYSELKYVPDKYIIDSLNLCYKKQKEDVYSGAFIFEIKFYENSYYDVASSLDDSKFMNDACLKIRTGKMWDKQFELEKEYSCSEKNLYKLKKAIGEILGENVEEEFVNYIVQKRIEAGKIPNSNIPKISEVKKIGKYTINTFCMNDKDIEIFIKRF